MSEEPKQRRYVCQNTKSASGQTIVEIVDTDYDKPVGGIVAKCFMLNTLTEERDYLRQVVANFAKLK